MSASLKPLEPVRSNTHRVWTLGAGTLTFALLMGFGSVVLDEVREERIERTRADAAARGQQLAAAIEAQFAHAVSAAHATGAFLKARAERAGDWPTHIEDFERFAQHIAGTVHGVHALELAPDGVIRQVFPLAGNERALGLNVLAEQAQRAEALEAIRARTATVAGPLKLRQGGMGAVVRLAVFADEGTKRERFWGFAIVLIQLETLLDQVGLHFLSETEWNYRLTRPASALGEELLIAASPDSRLARPVRVPVRVPNGEWLLELESGRGWVGNPARPYGVLALASLAFSALAALVYHLHMRIRLLAFYDPLTGCATRALFHDRLQQVLAASARRGRRAAVIYADLDEFKSINDTLGHAAGDTILHVVAQRFTRHLREADTIARMGGDEFALILTDLQGIAPAEGLARRLLDLLNEPVLIQGQPFRIGASIGISVYPDDARDPDQLLSLADHAMYRAKRGAERKWSFAQARTAAEGSARAIA